MGRRKTAVSAMLVTAIGMAVPVAAFAQDARWYLGGAVGQSDFKDACSGVPISCDSKDTSWKAFGGYQFTRNFAAELGYADFGKATASGTITGVAVNASGKSQAWDLVGVGSFPVADGFALYGKAGIYRAQTKVSATLAIAGFSTTTSDSDTNTGVTFGLGARYDFARNLGVRAEWQRYGKVGGDNVGGKDDIDVLSLGLIVKF